MTIMDAKLEFSDAQVVSCSSASAIISDNVFQMHALENAWGVAITGDYGNRNELVANVQVATDLNASSYIVAKLYSHTTATVTSGTSLGEVTFAAADSAGTTKNIKVPTGTINKFIGMEYSVVGSNMTTGAVDAWIGLDTEIKTT